MANVPNPLRGELVKHFGSLTACRKLIRRENGDLYGVGQFSSAINNQLNTQIGKEIRTKCWNLIYQKEESENVNRV